VAGRVVELAVLDIDRADDPDGPARDLIGRSLRRP
jgi:hypothetical protein